MRGETPAILAEVWGMKLATVETDASIAGLLIKLQADPEVAHAAYWQDVYAELELMQPLRARAAQVLQEGLDGKLYERIPDGDGGDMLAIVSPRGLKELSEALSELAQATDRCRDKIGKASGLLSSSTTVNLQAVLAAPVPVAAFGKVRVEDLADYPAQVDEQLDVWLPLVAKLCLRVAASDLDAATKAIAKELEERFRLGARNMRRQLAGAAAVEAPAPAPPAGGTGR